MTTEQITEEILWSAHSEGYYDIVMNKIREIRMKNDRLNFHECLEIAIEQLKLKL